MKDSVFNIYQLSCAYRPGMPVLQIDQLNIPRGKLVFVIGKSGIGKSTFIETLGLMNKTIERSEQTRVEFFASSTASSIELNHSWTWNNKKLSNFRRRYFSFVFQNTNLMPNFSAGENMMMSLLIEGRPMKQARKQVLEVMAKLLLPANVFDKKITELSGGQRQRLAFVRAITADFTVLFGDEPTGNLDENTANELMGTLKDLIVSEQKTGVIVSHDLRLARQFADWVIPITAISTEDGRNIGVIQPANIIHQSQGAWINGNDRTIEEPIAHFNKFLTV